RVSPQIALITPVSPFLASDNFFIVSSLVAFYQSGTTDGIPKESRRSPAGRRHRIFLGSHIPLHRRYRRSAEPCCSAAPLPAPSAWFGDRRRWVRRKPEKNTFSGMRG